MKNFFYNRAPIKWRIDDDGAMRITMCILKEGVYTYGADEVELEEFKGYKDVLEYIPLEEMQAQSALDSLEGKSIIIGEHEWRYADNALKDGQHVGAVAGSPYVEGDGLFCDAIIQDIETINRIQSGELIEVSAGYDGGLVVQGGEFDGMKYDAIQTDFRFNHVLLLPKDRGRCGPEVKIINEKQESKSMNKLTHTFLNGKKKTFTFTNAEDEAAAVEMVEEERAFNAEALATSMEEKKALTAQIEELSKQLAEHDEHLKSAKAQIEELISPEAQEAMATEVVEQNEDEEEVVEDLMNEEIEESDEEYENEEEEEEAKEKMLNSIRVFENGKKANLAERRANVVKASFKNSSMDFSKWTAEQFDATFESVVARAKRNNEKRREAQKNNRVLNGNPTQTKEKIENSTDPLKRMLRPMKNFNEKRRGK